MAARKLSEIATQLGMTLKGEDCDVVGVNTLESAGPDEVSFLANPKYVDQLAATRAGAVIVRPEHAGEVTRALISETPYQDFGRTLELFAVPQGGFTGISSLSSIHPSAMLGANVTVYPFVYIGPNAHIGDNVTLFPGCYVGENVRIGTDTTLYPNAVLMANVQVGNNCILHPGSVLGADGFGFARTPGGIQKIPQVGKVVVGNEVEVGANATIDRAVLDTTRIGDGTKIDNLVQLGHNVQVGRNNFIVSQVGVSGSTKIGDNCTLAGQVGVAGHLTIGDNVTIGPQSGVARNVPDNVTVGGTPTVDQRTYMRTLALMPHFPEIFKRLSKLEKMLETLPASSSGQPSNRNDV
ncbi:MAG: UDP-3-O-(3-hydroxymyristoyl)glucosamine N-acyltransferase [Bilophila sp.]